VKFTPSRWTAHAGRVVCATLLAAHVWTARVAAQQSQVRLAVAPAETLAVSITGAAQGSDLVIIPGLIGSAFAFRRIIPLLAAGGYRVVVVDPLGAGRSSHPDHADYSLAGQADRLAAALDSLGVTQALVVAQALGAAMAYRLAVARPDEVAGILSLNGGPAEQTATPGVRRVLRFAPLLRLFGGRSLLRRKTAEGLRRSSGDPSWVTEPVVDGYAAPYAGDLGEVLHTLQAIAFAREPCTLVPRLERIRAPVLLLVGDTPGGAIAPAEVGILAGRLPAFRVDTIRGAGQYLQEERPAEVLAAAARLQGWVTARGSALAAPLTPARTCGSSAGPPDGPAAELAPGARSRPAAVGSRPAGSADAAAERP